MAAKPWGWWTKHKLQILEDYLGAFARASTKPKHRIYLDLFGGWPENRDRDTGEEILGSVHRAVAADPPFTAIGVFELERKAERLKAELQRRYPNRSGIRVFPGDCNDSIDNALASLAHISWAPTFVFVDQFDCEVRWETLRKISEFKQGSPYKAEMWILFGTSFYPRGLAIDSEQMNARYAEQVTDMFGDERWLQVVEARRAKELSPADMRDELVNLMRWRLEEDLGYRYSHAFTVKNTNGNEIYHMIFMTDNDAGNRIMSHLYGKAVLDHAAMQRHAQVRRIDRRKLETGVQTLFDVEQSMLNDAAAGKVYTYEPPRPPYMRRR